MVSIIICTLNAEKTISQAIRSARLLNPLEIIVVDGNSKDKTVSIAKRHKVKVIYDNGSGLGNARNIGLGEAKGRYVLYMGPDNIFKDDINLIDVINEMDHYGYVGIGFRSTMQDFSFLEGFDKYLCDGMAHRWVTKIKSGQSKVIGTPFMFKKDVLSNLTFNSKSKYSDDTDICERIYKKNMRVGYSRKILAHDVWRGRKESVINRFKMYGKSDREFYIANKKNWGILRKIKSILHPMSEFEIIETADDLKYLPFVIYIVFWRYVGYAGF